jgi:xylan 1,4-beta-xylosidase
MGISNHLQEVDRGFVKATAIPALADKPVVIGESDPEGCAACPGPENAYRNGTMYSSYTAASFARIWDLAVRRKARLEGVLSWSFEFEDQPWFAGYRQLASNGVALPVLNVFRLFAQLGPERLRATSDAQVPLDRIVAEGVRGPADIGTIATRGADGRIAILVWHYHDDDVTGAPAAIRLTLSGLRGTRPAGATIWRVDETNGNAFSAWKRMGAPLNPDSTQYAALETAATMQAQPLAITAGQGRGNVTAAFDLPRQGVALVVLPGR